MSPTATRSQCDDVPSGPVKDTSPNDGKKPVLRTRTKYTPQQLNALERVFSESQYPDTDTMEQLADRMGVNTEKISVWFQNRRSKFKRQSVNSRVTWMRSQIYQREITSVSPDQNNRNQNKHVLSPPERSSSDHGPKHHRDDPKLNLHHIPNYAAHLGSLMDSKAQVSPHPVTHTVRPHFDNMTPTSPFTPISHRSSHDVSLQLSHLLNDNSTAPLLSTSPTSNNQSMFSFSFSYNQAMQYYQGSYSPYHGLVAPSV